MTCQERNLNQNLGTRWVGWFPEIKLIWVILGPLFAWIILLPNHCKIGSRPAKYFWNHLNQIRLHLHCRLMLPVKSNKDDVTPKNTNVFQMPNLPRHASKPRSQRGLNPRPKVLQERLGVKSKLGCHLASHLGGLEWVNYSIFVRVFFCNKKCQNGSLFGLMKCFRYSTSARLIYKKKQLSTEQLCNHPAANGSSLHWGWCWTHPFMHPVLGFLYTSP